MRSRTALHIAFALVCVVVAGSAIWPEFYNPCDWPRESGHFDCRSEPPTGVLADSTDSKVFAALFAQPGMQGSVINLAPATLERTGLGEALPEGMEFPRTELHSRSVFNGLDLMLATPRELAPAYKAHDPLHSGPFQRHFPGFQSILTLSHAFVSGGTAAVYVSAYCGGLCGSGTVYVFEKAESGWQLQRTIHIWIA